MTTIDQHILAVEGPTWLWNPAVTEERTRELEKDPETHGREFGAVPSQNEGTAWPKADVLPAFEPRKERWLWLEPFMVIDAAESADTFTFAVMKWGDPDPKTQYKWIVPPPGSGLTRGTFIGWQRDERGEPIPEAKAERSLLWVCHVGGFPGPEVRAMGLDRVVASLADTARRYGCRQIIGDDRAGPYLEAMFSKQRDVKFGFVNYANKKHEACVLVRTWLRDRMIAVVPSHDEMKRQMLRYRRRIVGGSFRYGKDGEKDDFAALFVTLGVHTIRAGEESAADPRIDRGPAQKFRGGRHVVRGL